MAATATTTGLRTGETWVSHREYAALRGGAQPTCEGTLHFTDVSRPNLVEVSCDGCALVVGADPIDASRLLETREEPWWQK